MKTKTIKQAHEDIIRQIALVEQVGFLTSSNDETIKLWTFDGEIISHFLGHAAFVFSVDCINFGNYASGSDDKTLKIWNDAGC